MKNVQCLYVVSPELEAFLSEDGKTFEPVTLLIKTYSIVIKRCPAASTIVKGEYWVPCMVRGWSAIGEAPSLRGKLTVSKAVEDVLVDDVCDNNIVSLDCVDVLNFIFFRWSVEKVALGWGIQEDQGPEEEPDFMTWKEHVEC